MGLRVIFFSTWARFFVAAAEDLSAKQRSVSLQHVAHKLRVCYTHTNARQTCDGMCVSMVTAGFGLGTRPDVDPAVFCAAQVSLQRIQRRKSLKANRSMKPIDILGSFFNEPIHGKRNRVPTRKLKLVHEHGVGRCC